MNSCLRIQRTCTLTALLFALALQIEGAANLFAQSGSLSGLVIRLDGSTMAGVEVRARPEEPNTAGLSAIVARTNASGQYRIDAIPPGTYVISAGPENGSEISLRTNLEMSFETLAVRTAAGTVERAARVTPTLMGPSRITLSGDSRPEFNILVVPSVVSVSGRLAIPAGFSLQPIRASLTRVQNSASVLAGDAPALPQILAETGVIRLMISDFGTAIDVQSDGTFHFPQIPPGEYVLRWIPNLGVPAASIVVANENITDIAPVSRSSGVRVGGNAAKSDKPPFQDKFPDWIYLIPRSARELQTIARTQLVQIASGPNSDALLRPAIPTISFVDATDELMEAPIAPVQPDGRFEFLSVSPGEYYVRTLPDTGIPDSVIRVNDVDIDNIRLGTAARVRGEVVSTNSGTRPPEVINLTSTRTRGQSVSAIVNANGSFEFNGIGPGTYRILLDGTVRPTPAEVEVGNEDAIIRVETPFAAWVPGRVMFDGPSPSSESLAATKVALSNGHAAEIKPDGTFQIKSNEGEFEFFMIAIPEGYILKSAVSGGANLFTESVKVDLRIPTPEILVTLQYKPETPQ